MTGGIFLRFIAVVLIVNSHCDYFYPFHAAATGGAIGNSLFFMLSAYGLYHSEIKHARSFAQWYTRRVARIYPSVWVALLLLFYPRDFFYGGLQAGDILAVLGGFFYPPFWFIQALMAIYFLIFLLIHNYSREKFQAFAVVTAVIYFAAYARLNLSVFSVEDLPFKIIFYFGVCLFGIWIARRDQAIRYAGLQDWLGLIACIAVLYGHKYLMTKHMLSSWQFIQHLILFPMVYYFVKIDRSPAVAALIERPSLFSSAARFVSKLTLEIYIVHMTIAPVIVHAQVAFPLNVIIFLLLTVVLSMAVHALAERLFVKNPVFS